MRTLLIAVFVVRVNIFLHSFRITDEGLSSSLAYVIRSIYL